MGASAGVATLLNGVEQDFFEDVDGATEVFVKCVSGSAFINIPGLHGPSVFTQMAVGTYRRFTINHMGIKTMTGKGDGGNADINFGVVSKTVVQ